MVVIPTVRNNMSTRTALIVLLGLAMALAGCKKKEDTTIIVKKTQLQPEQPKTTGQMSVSQWSKTIDWIGAKYLIQIERQPDKSLPLAKDETGRSYYDNVIHLTISRPDGTKFLDREFHKSDMRKYVPSSFYENGALLGLVFDRAEGGVLYFGTSVGSPDSMSDEYVPLILKIDRKGGISISKDDDLDGSQPAHDEAAEELRIKN